MSDQLMLPAEARDRAGKGASRALRREGRVPAVVYGDNEEAAPGLKRGGVLNLVQHELELVCDAASIPNEIHIDLTGLEIGDSIHISHVKLPEGVTPSIDDRDFTVATIVAPSALKSEE